MPKIGSIKRLLAANSWPVADASPGFFGALPGWFLRFGRLCILLELMLFNDRENNTIEKNSNL